MSTLPLGISVPHVQVGAGLCADVSPAGVGAESRFWVDSVALLFLTMFLFDTLISKN